MSIVLRGLIYAILAALAFAMFLPTPVQAQSWMSGVSSGLTSVESFVDDDGVFTWVLKNNTGYTNSAPYEVLIWSLMPFQINQPSFTSAPEGWQWSGNQWQVAAQNKKYYTPYALGPRESISFKYNPNYNTSYINPQGPQPDSLNFIAHVTAVIPDSGSFDGTTKWISTESEFGDTWFDYSMSEKYDPPLGQHPVPEPGGVMIIGIGLANMCIGLVRRAKRRN